MDKPRYGSHGGGCCGIIHIFGFGYPDENGFDARKATNLLRCQILRAVKAEYGDIEPEEDEDDTWQCLVEAVMIEDQLEGAWRSVLTELGFKQVNSFHNSNSGNTCYVFHLNFDYKEFVK